MSIVTVSGAEEGIVIQGLNTAQNRLWSISAGTTTIDTVTYRSGAKSYKFAAAATLPYLGRTCAATRSVAYFRGYFYLTDATPASGPMYLVLVPMAATPNMGINVSTGGVLTAQFTTGESQTGPTLSDNTWYGIEAEFDASTNPTVLRWRTWDSVNGWVDQTSVTKAQAADTVASVRFGRPSGGPTATLDTYFDDVIIGEGTTTGEHYGVSGEDIKVLRYRPSADGTHSFSTSGDFKYDNTTNFASSATDVYTYLDDDDQTSTADYIAQAAAGTGEYVEVLFADESTENSPRYVGITSVHLSSTTGANEMHMRASDDGTNWTNVWGDWATTGLDISDTATVHNLHKVLSTKPSGGSWTQDAVNGLRIQWGNSDDVVGVPYIHSVSIQVAWGPATTATVSDPFGMSGFFGV